MPTRRDAPNLPAVIEDAYALWLWLDARVQSFPVSARREHGRHVVDTAVALLDALTRAHYGRGEVRRAMLDEANARVALLRLLVRGARELRRISPDQHAHASERLDAIGRQVGAWRRSDPGAP